MYQELKNFSERERPLFEERVEALKKKISALETMEKKYNVLIEMGRGLPPLEEQHKTKENLVRGCQSALHLYSFIENGNIFFEASSDALISAGLAALLISIYSGLSPETILKNPPHFLHELGIYVSLSPHRSNGLSQLHLRMKQDALKAFFQYTQTTSKFGI